MTTKPELIDTGSDERFVRRNEKGQFKSDDLGCLSADRHRTAKTKQGLVRATGIGRSGIIRSPLELASTADKSFKSAGETGMSLKCLDQFPDRPDWSVLSGHLHCDLVPVLRR